MENYRIVLKVNLKKLQTPQKALFASYKTIEIGLKQCSLKFLKSVCAQNFLCATFLSALTYI